MSGASEVNLHRRASERPVENCLFQGSGARFQGWFRLELSRVRVGCRVASWDSWVSEEVVRRLRGFFQIGHGFTD